MDATGRWRRLARPSPFTVASLAETLDGGQAFRWENQTDGTWRGQWGGHVVQLKLTPAGLLWGQARSDEATVTEAALRHYLALDATDHPGVDNLPWRSDPHLARCIEAFPGLRILRQPLGETLLGFLCSATKQIGQIKQMLALLATRHGSLLPTAELGGVGPPAKALPTWTQLAAITEDQLRACQLGFRARYIKGTADVLAAHPGWLETLATLSYPEAKSALCTLPGVGEKIADCVALFGLGHLQAFPVDTWMIKAMSRHYGLPGWSPQQIAHFGRVHFGSAAGLAQQYLFAWERHYSRR